MDFIMILFTLLQLIQGLEKIFFKSSTLILIEEWWQPLFYYRVKAVGGAREAVPADPS